MRWGSVLATAGAVAFCLMGAPRTLAGDGGARFILFSGADLWRNGGFLHGGLLWSPGGLDRDGFTFKAILSGGTYRYSSGALGNAEVKGRELTTQLMGRLAFHPRQDRAQAVCRARFAGSPADA
jgi:hypothetical protein